MAWEARLGLKPARGALRHGNSRQAKWPGKPVWD